MSSTPPVSISSLKREVVWTYLIQLALVLVVVQLARWMAFEGALSAIIGAIFIFLPVWVLDRRGRPYRRYGLKLVSPLRDLPVVLAFILATWPPIVLAVLLFPQLWQLPTAAWQFTVPEGYASIAVAHFLVVALPEEFFFRGYLLGRLDDIFPGRRVLLGVEVGHGLWISSLLFAVGHFMVDFQVSRLLVFFPALAFGYLRLKRNSIAASVIFHGCCNVFMDLFRAGLGL
jgi:uncharacterized protein